jgi:hypothetical protein
LPNASKPAVMYATSMNRKSSLTIAFSANMV